MGDHIPDTSHAMRLLHMLLPSWDGVCQVLQATQPTTAKVKDCLLAEEEARHTTMAFANSGTASALATALHDPNSRAYLQVLVSTQFGNVLLNPDTNISQPGNAQGKRQQ
jgi:hypothetical protein